MLPSAIRDPYRFNVPITVDAGYTPAQEDDIYAAPPLDPVELSRELGLKPGKLDKQLKMPKPGQTPFEKKARKLKLKD